MTGIRALLFAGSAGCALAFWAPTTLADTSPCTEIAVPMSDGVKLDGWFRPAAGGGKAPVLWTMTPYTNTSCPSSVNIIDNDISSQFNLVQLSYRGDGASEGVSDEWGPQTAKDVMEVGNWISAQPWADGLIPTGASAEGAWITYALQHPDVKAALWEMSCADALRGCIRTGGELAGGAFALTAGILEGYAQGIPQRVQNGYDTNPDPASQWAGAAPAAASAYADDYNTQFWKDRLGLQYLERVHAPVMYTTDLYDFVPEGMYVAYENTDPQYRWLNLGYGHSSPAPVYGDTQLRALLQVSVRRFLEKYGLGVDNGFENDPRVTLMTNMGWPSAYKRGEVMVRSESDWPLPETNWTRLYFGGGSSGSAKSLNDGTLSSSSPARGFDVSPLASAFGPKGELRTVYVASGSMPAQQGDDFRKIWFDDLSPDETAALTYTSGALAQDIELTGPIVTTLYAQAAANDFDWQVRLTDVHSDGSSSWISDGQLRASLREIDPTKSRRNAGGDIIRPWYTFDKHQPVPPNRIVRYYVELAPTSNIFRAGDRIRVDIQPIADGYVDSARTGVAGVLRLMRGGGVSSSILLPLIPNRCQDGVAATDTVQVPADCAGSLQFTNG